MASIDPALSRGALTFALFAALVAPWAIRAPSGAKPLRFAVSIAIFLATMALITPLLAFGARARSLIAFVLVGTMSVEFVAIVMQAARGTSSHFNAATPLDASVWAIMVLCIVVAVIAMTVVAVVASIAPLSLGEGPARALLAFSVRAGLWIFLLSALSGFAMGGRGSHSIPHGTHDAATLAVVGWSRSTGDLRVSHFLSLHALQALPLVAVALSRLSLPRCALWTALVSATAVFTALPLYTFARALSGRASW